MLALRDAAQSARCIRLTFAEHEQRPAGTGREAYQGSKANRMEIRFSEKCIPNENLSLHRVSVFAAIILRRRDRGGNFIGVGALHIV